MRSGLPEEILGVWLIGPGGEPDCSELVEIHGDGRVAYCFRQSAGLPHGVMALRISADADERYLVKTTPDAKGYVISLHLEESGLVFVNAVGKMLRGRRVEGALPFGYDRIRLQAVWR